MPNILSEAPKRNVPRRRHSPEERRRIVELTFRKDACMSEIARAHDIHPSSLSSWRSVYRAGKLPARSTKDNASGNALAATFLPVTMMPQHIAVADASQTSAHTVIDARERTIVQVTFPSGATLRLETGTLDRALLAGLLAEMRS